jgi:drug/metabolite transporter (DMT)-like permease
MSLSKRGGGWVALAPGIFVVLWSSGFIGSKLGIPHAEPFTFLALRFALVLAILVPTALLTRAPWPQGRQLAQAAVAGLLMQALYLSGCVWSLRLGLSAGVLSLIASMQPILTAALAGMVLNECVLPRQWLGLALGFVGTGLVVAHKMGSGLTVMMICPAVMALLGLTAGTLWQKRFCAGLDLRTGAVVQYAASLLIIGPLALLTESCPVHWCGEFVISLLWGACVLSIGAITLLSILIRSGSAVNVASLFYAVPAVTCLMAWGLFGERLVGLSLVGMVGAISGVWLARR